MVFSSLMISSAYSRLLVGVSPVLLIKYFDTQLGSPARGVGMLSPLNPQTDLCFPTKYGI